MAGTIKVDSINADSNLALKIANTAVAFIDATGLRPVAGNLNLDATATSKLYLPSANTVAIQTAGVTAVTVDSSQNVTLAGTLTTTGITNSGVATGARFNPTGSSATGTGMYLPAANSLGLSANGTNAVYIDSSQRIGIGTSSPEANAKMTVYGGGIGISTNGVTTAPTGYDLKIRSNTSILGIHTDNSSGVPTLEFGNGNSGYCTIKGTAAVAMTFQTNSTEAMRIDSSGRVLFGTTNGNPGGTSGTGGVALGGNNDGNYYPGVINASALGNASLVLNRSSDDGNIVIFKAQENTEGTISVSGTTVSYNGGHLARYSQLPTGARDVSIVKGTVMSNLDAMCEWLKDGEPTPNEQLNKMKVSDVEGDKNVAGVFVNWDNDDKDNTFDMNIAMTGDMIIRIAEGVTVQKGDLLMSAGDGTAKPQGDDIVRSKTIAKVTSNHITCTYADGSYCVPCVLMAC